MVERANRISAILFATTPTAISNRCSRCGKPHQLIYRIK
ncbi:MAG TPA: hypothetical protein K8W15_00780 [Gallibacterium anatis]|uniref:Uncharacterized protein n=1 Tax=Gallibacterium anatis TaxID=750 RepID=A0A921H9L6_9PAST|nr:hypothetical protein [Gallibacterium anatis]